MIAICRINRFGLGQSYREWISMDTVYAELIVQMGAGRQAGATNIADDLPLLDLLALAHTIRVGV